MIFRDTVQSRTMDCRGSPAFQDWRAIVGPYFASPPVIEHFTLLAKSA